MHVISRKKLNEFVEVYPDAKPSLARWYQLMKQNSFSNFAQLRAVFPSADQVHKFTVFDIEGNRVRLIAAIHYNRQKVYIRSVMTHSEYDREHWKK